MANAKLHARRRALDHVPARLPTTARGTAGLGRIGMSRHNELGEIRRSQVVSTYGPGSIVAYRAGRSGDAAISVVAAGLETWEEVPPHIIDATRIYEPRLANLLRVNHF